MKLLVSFTLSVFLFMPLPAFAEIKIVTHTIQQPFGGSESPDDARTAGIARAKREALEKFGTYIESTTVVKDSQLDSDEILALTAGVTKAEVLTQKNYTDGDTFGIEITVKVELDDTVVEKSLKRLIYDRSHLKDLAATRAREKKLLLRITELEKQNKQKGKTKKQSDKLKKDFKVVSQGITAVDWLDKAMALWDGQGIITNPIKAIEFLTQAIRLDPNYAMGYLFRGVAQTELNQFESAVNDFNEAIRLDPTFANSYGYRGNAYRELKQYDLAIADFNRGISINNTIEIIYTLRANTYIEMKQYDHAISDLDEVIRLNPNKALGYSLLGSVYKNLKKYDRAITEYDQAILINNTNPSYYIARGNIYSKLKKHELALSDFDQAIRIDQKHSYAYFSRGNAYDKLNKLQYAMFDYNQAIKLDPQEASNYVMRGFLFMKSSDIASGCNDFSKACQLGDCDTYESFRKDGYCR